MDSPPIEQVKIQAKVVVPLIKTLRAKLGEERRRYPAQSPRRPLSRGWRAMVAPAAGIRPRRKDGRDLRLVAGGDALDYEVVNLTANTFGVNIVGCRYSKFFHEISEPELGFLLVCSADFPMSEGFGDDVKLTRTQTIMEGASHCDFRYALKK